MTRCFCGCGAIRGLALHHLVYQQELRRLARSIDDGDLRAITLCQDRRNLVVVGPACHAAHHNRSKPYRLSMLPDAAFEFAGDVLGPERAFEYLRRRYGGSDVRHERLLLEVAA
jgi:hypothetical protein